MQDPFFNPTGVIPRVRTSYVAGGAAGNRTVTGIVPGDRLLSVVRLALTEGAPNTFAAVVDLTAEFTITAADTINNTGGTTSAGGLLVVVWYDHDWGETVNAAHNV